MTLNLNFPAPGSVLFTFNPGKFGRVTARATADPHQSGTTATHIGNFVTESILTESRPRSGPLGTLRSAYIPIAWCQKQSEMKKAGIEYIILSPDPILTHHELRAYQIRTMKLINTRYAFLELPLQLLDERREDRTGKRSYLWRKLGRIIPGNGICSKLTPKAMGPLWPKGKDLDDPDHLLDWLLAGNLYNGRHWLPIIVSDNWHLPIPPSTSVRPSTLWGAKGVS